MGYRKIDADRIFRGFPHALKGFSAAFTEDCGGDRETWHRVYRFTPEALNTAINRATALGYLPAFIEGATTP